MQSTVCLVKKKIINKNGRPFLFVSTSAASAVEYRNRPNQMVFASILNKTSLNKNRSAGRKVRA